MKYYCVTSIVYDRGINVDITSIVDADKKPKNTYRYFTDRDVYNDWFDSLEKAKEFCKYGEAMYEAYENAMRNRY